MTKREFRTHAQDEARYPTFESFERGCRDLLAGLALGAALLGGAAGCGDRAVQAAPDAAPELATTHPPGAMPMPPSPLDLQLPPDAGRDLTPPSPDLTPPSPDLPDNIAGGAPMPPAPIDLGPGQD